uniref:NADH-ubiquinone oxidoreductase chain 4L n=1 Tax=Anisocentropus maculatus TaxID=2904904 RepID=A0A9E8LNQ1_9NEOP|nr:NADH dehydrogenase subunit 4L [Anisocentropus maculatus]UZZ43762.1 NADH dehydrogenase subunit 4L [Anisocentropus maculatus]
MKIFKMMIFIVSFFFANYIFCMNRKHLLVMLLMLEFMILNLLIILFYYLNFMNYDYYFFMMFIVLMVCEGVLGISILVNMVRMYGNDYFQIFNFF